MDMDLFLEEQRAAQQSSLEARDKMFRDAGFDPKDFPPIDLANVDHETRMELQKQFGVDLKDLMPAQPKTATSWRMRTKAMMV